MSEATPDPMTDDDKRRDQLLRAAESTEADAAPRIVTSREDDVTRIDIADSAAVRPGPGPGAEGEADPS
ncbi:multidrug transporter [Microbacterium sp. CFBP9034]|uniref:multidrug transporter n=1 Tax=Microbacterium sp. CFBP9034 TaxID=3096540 RepID=UPI002A6AF984|nr:multidrug transporter [Microbacterium sp. CFBP9034]MDY0910453.1 multidrug transporter [Microbacterium sp. CFBP9034]